MISSNLTLQNLCVLLNCVMKSVSNDIHDSCNLIFGQYATSFLFSLIYFPEKFTFINNSTSSMSRRIANDLEIFFWGFSYTQKSLRTFKLDHLRVIDKLCDYFSLPSSPFDPFLVFISLFLSSPYLATTTSRGNCAFLDVYTTTSYLFCAHITDSFHRVMVDIHLTIIDCHLSLSQLPYTVEEMQNYVRKYRQSDAAFSIVLDTIFLTDFLSLSLSLHINH